MDIFRLKEGNVGGGRNILGKPEYTGQKWNILGKVGQSWVNLDILAKGGCSGVSTERAE